MNNIADLLLLLLKHKKMEKISDLFKGVGVIIDDDLNPEKEQKTDSIWNIKKSFEDKNIPILTYYELPDDKIIDNFHSISFLLLDWDLKGLGVGIDLPQAVITDNIIFIYKFNGICFAPIFIFSNENPDDIKRQLSDFGLFDDTKSNNIFVKAKSDFETIDLFTAIEKWIEQTPSIYVLKEWELSIRQAKNSLFWDFYNINPDWAKILYETINKDSGDFSYEMNDILFENLKTRTIPNIFDVEILSSTDAQSQISSDEIKKVLEGQRFRKHNEDMIFTGDVFHKDNKYYINVRPQCDCIPRKKGQTVDDISIYLIEATTLKHLEKHYDNNYGLFIDKDSQFTIFPINNGNALRFEFELFTTTKFQDWKQYRIGTLLPPFITRLVQKFVSYMQRQGLPRIPEKAIK
jgi:hypothetical protein